MFQAFLGFIISSNLNFDQLTQAQKGSLLFFILDLEHL